MVPSRDSSRVGEPADHPYIIGIDLGTTNCAVSYVDLREAEGSANPTAPPPRQP